MAGLRIVVLEGDQTGQELLDQALRVIAPAVIGLDVELERFDLSLESRRRTKNEVCTEAARNDSGEIRAVRLVVVDNGPGFPEKVLKRAFEPYVTTKKKGTGLGLAVVKKIADEHGARIRIANLGTSSEGDAAGGLPRGAQVSLSFAKFATVVGTPPDAH